EALATSPALDAVVIYAPGYMLDRMADSIVAVARAHNRFFAAIDTGHATSRDLLREAGVAVFDDLGLAVAALGPFLSWQERRRHHVLRAGSRGAQPLPVNQPALPDGPLNEAQA